MKITVKLVANEVEERSIEIENDDTYEKMLERQNINPEEVVVLRNGKPVPENERVVDKNNTGAEITIIRIVSSG